MQIKFLNSYGLIKLEDKMTKNNTQKVKVINKNPPPAMGIFFLGFIGAAIHFVSSVDGFWNIALALLKALVWPAFLVHRVFDLLRI